MKDHRKVQKMFKDADKLDREEDAEELQQIVEMACEELKLPKHWKSGLEHSLTGYCWSASKRSKAVAPRRVSRISQQPEMARLDARACYQAAKRRQRQASRLDVHLLAKQRQSYLRLLLYSRPTIQKNVWR